jgi:hypothetical protein
MRSYVFFSDISWAYSEFLTIDASLFFSQKLLFSALFIFFSSVTIILFGALEWTRRV